MVSVLNSSSAIFRVGRYNYTYDLTTQGGLSNFWDYILSVIPATIYPGMVANEWDDLDHIYIKLPGNETYLITGEGQIWLHGMVETNSPFSWNQLSLCVINVVSGITITLRLDYAGIADIRLSYAVHRPE